MGQVFVSKVDKILSIPAIKAGFSNKEDWLFNLKAGKPVPIGNNVQNGEVPMEIAKAFSDSYPNTYAIQGEGQPIPQEPEATNETTNSDANSDEFDAANWLAQNYNATEDEINESLKKKEMLAVCEKLELNANPTDRNDMLASKIAQELAVRNGTAGKE